MAAMIKIIVTTINNSMSEKPFRLLWRIFMQSPVTSRDFPRGTTRSIASSPSQNAGAGNSALLETHG
jgi:hypothetical protein